MHDGWVRDSSYRDEETVDRWKKDEEEETDGCGKGRKERKGRGTTPVEERKERIPGSGANLLANEGGKKARSKRGLGGVGLREKDNLGAERGKERKKGQTRFRFRR